MATASLSSDLLPSAEAAAYLGVREQTLAVWRSTGRYDLRFIKSGRLVRYRRADLDAWLESRTATQTG
jgi:excisionase family DNA binding protein